MLYQVYLGYKIGIWALIPQLAWSASYFLLAMFSAQISVTNGLHSFLGAKYSNQTRMVAAVLSIVGLGLQIGWEYNVTKSAMSGLTPSELPPITLGTLVLTIFAIGTFYTLMGGLRSNLWTDLLQNVLKSACFLLLCVLLLAVVPEFDYRNTFRPFSAVVAELGLIGFTANVAFSLAWQFVDLSTWQAAIATESGINKAKGALQSAGLWVFVAPGILGTVMGIGLSGYADLTSDTVLPALVKLVGGQPWIIFILTVAIATCAMSFVDTMMLGIGLTAVTDLMFRSKVDQYNLLQASEVADRAHRQGVANIIGWARLTLLGTAVMGTFVIGWISDWLGISLFDLVYVVVVSQLSMFGSVMIGLLNRRPTQYSGILATLSALVAGYGLSIYGGVIGNSDMVNGAPLLSLILSFAVAWSCSTKAARSTG